MASLGLVKRGKPLHCPAVRYGEVFTRGYSCEHAPGHDGSHRDKHGVEWEDET